MTTTSTTSTISTTTQQRQHRRLTSVVLDGFCGHHLTVPLAPVTLVTGPNQSGKTSVRDAISLAVSGRIPGAPADGSAGMTTVEYLSDCTPDTDRFKVSVVDTKGQRASFAFSRTERTTRRDVTSTLAEGRINDTHRAAIAQYFGITPGDPTGLIALDIDALRRVPPDQLEMAIIRLCGGDANPTDENGEPMTPMWAVRRMVDSAVITVVTDPAHEAALRAALDVDSDGTQGIEAIAQHVATVAQSAMPKDADGICARFTDVLIRDAVAILRTATEAQISDSLARTKAQSADVALIVPPAPSATEINALRATMEAAQAQTTAAAEALGRLKERRDAAINAHAEAEATATKDLEGAKVAGAEVTHRWMAAQNVADAIEKELTSAQDALRRLAE